MPKYEDHECLLVRQEEDIVKQFIDTGVFIAARRRFRSWCMISQTHPNTAKYFKSNSARRSEEIIHLVHNYYMIHPFSKLNLWWDYYMFMVFSLQFILIPLDAAMPQGVYKIKINIVTFIMDLLQLADIIKLFYTGFYDFKKSKVILDHGLISMKYICSYFFIDLISSCYSYTYPLRAMDIIVIKQKHKIPIKLLNRLKIARMIRWLTIMEIFRQSMGYSSYLFKGIKVVLVFLIVTFWAFSINCLIEMCVHTYVKKLEDNDTSGNRTAMPIIFRNYYEATLLLLMVSYGQDNISEWLEYANAIFFLCFGFALQLFVYAQILQVWTKYASAETKHHTLHKQFKEYMKYKELPVSLRERIFSYFQFKFHKQFFKESDINNMVSPLLKQEIMLHVTRNHVERVEFFKHLPENILMKVVAQLKSEIYLPGDVIISAGSVGTSMFFIYHGTVAVYSPIGKEICHLEDGAHFGEIALILSETRVATVVAVTASEMFMLRRSDFLAAIEPFPQFRDQIMALATERLHKTISSGRINSNIS